VIGFIYPAYLSFKALETESKDDDKLLLTYWTVYGFMTLFDPILVFAFSWIPMFQFIKVIILINSYVFIYGCVDKKLKVL